MLKRVTMGVRTRTSNRQRPEVVSSMAVEFYFSRIETGSTNLQSQEIETEKQALEGLRAAEKSGAREAYQAIIDKYPMTTSAAVARQALKAPQAKVNRDENQSESANLLTATGDEEPRHQIEFDLIGVGAVRFGGEGARVGDR